MNDQHLERAIVELAKREFEFVEAFKDLPIKKHAYKLRYAVEVRKADGAVEVKKACATEICEKELLDYETAESRAEIAKTLLWDCRDVLSARRSLLSNERSEREFAASGMAT